MSTSPHMVTLAGKQYPLVWSPVSVYRADDTGLAEKLAAGKFGYSVLCRMIHVMLSDKDRVTFSTPESVAVALPVADQKQAWEAAMGAFALGNGTEDTDAKKGGGASAPSPSSS